MSLMNDVFCRAAVFPRCLSNDDRITNSSLIKFSGRGLDPRGLSLASKYLCRTEEGVHDYGQKVAIAGNNRILECGHELNDENENIYLGFYSFLKGDFLEISSSLVTLRLYWKSENGEERHFQVDIYPNKNAIEKSVEEAILSQKEDHEKRGKKFTEPNRQSRAERVVDQEVREIRERIFDILFGPSKLITNDGKVKKLQQKYMVELPQQAA